MSEDKRSSSPAMELSCARPRRRKTRERDRLGLHDVSHSLWRAHAGFGSWGRLDVKHNDEACYERELQNLRAKWGNVLAADPYYNPMLSSR